MRLILFEDLLLSPGVIVIIVGDRSLQRLPYRILLALWCKCLATLQAKSSHRLCSVVNAAIGGAFEATLEAPTKSDAGLVTTYRRGGQIWSLNRRLPTTPAIFLIGLDFALVVELASCG